MRALQRGFGEQDAVVGDDADRIAAEMREAADQRRAVELLEFVELAAVDDAGDDLAHVVGLARSRRDDAVEFRRVDSAARRGAASIERGRLRRGSDWRRCGGQIASAWRSFCGVVIDHAGDARHARRRRRDPRRVTTSPVAAFTSGGPPRKIVPCSLDDDRSRRSSPARRRRRRCRSPSRRRSAGCPRPTCWPG